MMLSQEYLVHSRFLQHVQPAADITTVSAGSHFVLTGFSAFGSYVRPGATLVRLEVAYLLPTWCERSEEKVTRTSVVLK